MKRLIPIFLCVALVGCSTTREVAAKRTLQRADPMLARESSRAGFERRLGDLGAKIETGANPEDERTATFSAPPRPGYFPPPIVRVVYAVTHDGMVSLRSTDVVSLGVR